MANTGLAPADFKTDVGRFRLLIGDTDPSDVNQDEKTGTYVFYSDAEIEALIEMGGGSYRRAAIQSLRMIAGSQVMLLKKWSSADLSVDGPAIADALRGVARDLENDMVAEAADDVGTFVVPTGGVSWSAQRALHSDESYLDLYGVGRELDRGGFL